MNSLYKLMNENLESAFKNMQELDRAGRIKLTKELIVARPDFMIDITPKWWHFSPCQVNVLLVADGGLHFGLDDFGLSEFITSFQKLEQESSVNIRYKVTLAHRSLNPGGVDPMLNSNTSIVNRITNFAFAPISGKNTTPLTAFDQIWLFGIDSGATLQNNELTAIETYMNGGGGLFATGDHGSLGGAMGRGIVRVKDMRIWSDTNVDQQINEVSMGGRRRNDTNRPAAGATVSDRFDNQADNIPQNIAVRTFGAGMPHPLLSISPTKHASGIIDIMPDHPHEGECKQETSFTVNGTTISTQIIATSFVLGGSTIEFNGKTPTEPHCFPSISVFDGRIGNVGRIVIDSTWHHFVNINLVGFSNSNFDVIQQYYMNIAVWMSRKKNMLCFYKYIIIRLMQKSKIIEASLNDPKASLKNISLTDLNSIGMLAREIVGTELTPVFAEQFMLDMLEYCAPDLANNLNSWNPKTTKSNVASSSYIVDWINYDNIVGTAIGSGFIALRDAGDDFIDKLTDKTLDNLFAPFFEGIIYGVEASIRNLQQHTDLAFKSVLSAKAINKKPKL